MENVLLVDLFQGLQQSDSDRNRGVLIEGAVAEQLFQIFAWNVLRNKVDELLGLPEVQEFSQ